MIAPPINNPKGAVPGQEALRADQFFEAGLWLQLGGHEEGARSLVRRALASDPSNRRAREWLATREAMRGTVAASAPAPESAAEPVRSEVEVSVVLLDEAEMASAAAAQESGLTADVVLMLEESAEPGEAPPLPVRAQGVATLLLGVEEMLMLGDLSSAIELLDKAEKVAPGDGRLGVMRERCEREQRVALERRLGNLKQVPLLKLRMAELMKLSLDARAGFLLSRIDGRLSYESLFSVSGMPRLDTLKVLVRLLDQDIIALR